MLQHAGRCARGRYVQAGPELFRQRRQRHHAGSHHHPRAWTQVSTTHTAERRKDGKIKVFSSFNEQDNLICNDY